MAMASGNLHFTLDAGLAGLHVKPLSPLLNPRESEPDTAFMRTFTNPAYFAAETALLAVVALLSPIRYLHDCCIIGLVLHIVCCQSHRSRCKDMNIPSRQ